MKILRPLTPKGAVRPSFLESLLSSLCCFFVFALSSVLPRFGYDSSPLRHSFHLSVRVEVSQARALPPHFFFSLLFSSSRLLHSQFRVLSA